MSLRSNATDGPVLVFEDVSVVRDRRLIWSEGTFEVPSGGIVAVIGANGAGKTTLAASDLGTGASCRRHRPSIRQTPGRE